MRPNCGLRGGLLLRPHLDPAENFAREQMRCVRREHDLVRREADLDGDDHIFRDELCSVYFDYDDDGSDHCANPRD